MANNVPFYGAFTERSAQNDQQGLRDLQQAGALFNLHEQVLARRREQEMRQLIQQNGGDLEKAAAAAVQSGNFQGAAKLAPLIEARRKASAPRVMTPGSQLLGPNNEVLHTTPAVPRPEALPKLIQMQNFLRDNGPRMPPQARAQLEAAIEREARGSERGPFGAGATGGALEIITKLAPAYGEGQLTPDNERLFDSAVAHYTQPRQFQDPDSGLMVTRKPELPPFAQEALSRRRGARPAQPQPAPSPQPTMEPQQPTGQAQQPSKTAWDLAPLTTGPVPAAAEMLSRTPLVGDMMQAPQFTQARSYVPQLQRDLVRVLQNNPRYAEGERKAIEKDINIEPRLFDNPTSYRDRLIGIDDSLAVRERNAENTSKSPNVGREERIQAMNVLNAVRAFRKNLGVPPRIGRKEDYDTLPEGQVYIDSRDGKVKRKTK